MWDEQRRRNADVVDRNGNGGDVVIVLYRTNKGGRME